MGYTRTATVHCIENVNIIKNFKIHFAFIHSYMMHETCVHLGAIWTKLKATNSLLVSKIHVHVTFETADYHFDAFKKLHASSNAHISHSISTSNASYNVLIHPFPLFPMPQQWEKYLHDPITTTTRPLHLFLPLPLEQDFA